MWEMKVRLSPNFCFFKQDDEFVWLKYNTTLSIRSSYDRRRYSRMGRIRLARRT